MWTRSGTFFATSHGKNACDGIGGTLKRAASRARLQRPDKDQILTPDELFRFCSIAVGERIRCFFVPVSEVAMVEKKLAGGFKDAKVIKVTRAFDIFLPNDNSTVMCHVLSEGSAVTRRVSKA